MRSQEKLLLHGASPSDICTAMLPISHMLGPRAVTLTHSLRPMLSQSHNETQSPGWLGIFAIWSSLKKNFWSSYHGKVLSEDSNSKTGNWFFAWHGMKRSDQKKQDTSQAAGLKQFRPTVGW
jgi:hypothetical protein